MIPIVFEPTIFLNETLKTTCLKGQTKLAEDDASTGYQNGLPCKCAAWTPAVPTGECVNNERPYTRTCDNDTSVTFVNAPNECVGDANFTAGCGDFKFDDWEWLYCSENCGLGEQIGTRKCTQLGDVACPEPGTCIDDATCVYKTRPCQIQKCLTCANYANYCDNRINTKCVDVTLENGESTVR